MTREIPEAVFIHLTNELPKQTGTSVFIKHFTALSGGCINHGGKLGTSEGDFFLKWNKQEECPGMFRAEARGLDLMRKATDLEVPEVILVGETTSYQYLVLRYIPSGEKSDRYWEQLGEGLARLHRCTSPTFGLDHDNYIGSLPQTNQIERSWIDFFIEQRIEKQLTLIENRRVTDHSLRKRIELLYPKLPAILTVEPPSLLHGDLWSGNMMTNSSGTPCLIDPAVYFGNREVDLGMTELFGGFSKRFYQAYESAYPLEPGSAERRRIYNLYPLMVHVNLFGVSYLSEIQSILQHYQ